MQVSSLTGKWRVHTESHHLSESLTPVWSALEQKYSKDGSSVHSYVTKLSTTPFIFWSYHSLLQYHRFLREECVLVDNPHHTSHHFERLQAAQRWSLFQSAMRRGLQLLVNCVTVNITCVFTIPLFPDGLF